MKQSNIKQVDIIGTCLTRELFNYTREYKVNTYIMQQSIYTINAKPYNIDLQEIELTDNFNFKRRMVYYDFNKLAFTKIKENPQEYLIIDLADQSRDIVLLEDYPNTSLTKTSAILEMLNKLKLKYLIKNIEEYSKEELYSYIKSLTDLILPLYEPSKIILNKVELQNEYYENNVTLYTDNNIQVYKRLYILKELENYFQELIPECKTLSAKYCPILDINHRLGGPHPGHFESIYYQYRMNLLDAIINNQEIKPVEEEYMRVYNQEIENIKRKVRVKL